MEPTGVDIDRAEAITITWDGGDVRRFGLEDLRVNCPCAQCRGLRATGQPVWPRPESPLPLAIVHAELVGAWGISLVWNDGHSTGIYTWDALAGGAD